MGSLHNEQPKLPNHLSVLIIEDNRIHLDLLYQTVCDLNGLPTLAWDFDIALNALRNIVTQYNTYYDLIILDVGLPGMPHDRPCLLIELLRQNPHGCDLYLCSSWEMANKKGFSNGRLNKNKNYVGNEKDYISALIQHPEKEHVAILVCQDKYNAWLKVEVDLGTIPLSILQHGWDNALPYSIQYNDKEAMLITKHGGYVHPIYNHQNVDILFNSANPKLFQESALRAAQYRNIHFTERYKIVPIQELEAILNAIGYTHNLMCEEGTPAQKTCNDLDKGFYLYKDKGMVYALVIHKKANENKQKTLNLTQLAEKTFWTP